jgi:RsiW-degrading membrane proteinase PrsW (M82 family)
VSSTPDPESLPEPSLDPSEWYADPTGDERDVLEHLRDAVHHEPHLAGPDEAPARLDWLKKKRAESGWSTALAWTAVAALLGGPFSVLGAIMGSGQGVLAAVYVVLLGPVAEEMLKPAGAIVLLERKPWHLRSAWQVVFIAVASALGFATIENLIYEHVYLSSLPAEKLAEVMTLRWTFTAPMHVLATFLASVGLLRVWRRVEEGATASLAPAYPWFAAAMVLHGGFNLTALLRESFG